MITLYISNVEKIDIKTKQIKKIISNLQDKAQLRRNLKLYSKLFMKQKILLNFNLENNMVRKDESLNIILKGKRQLFELKIKQFDE